MRFIPDHLLVLPERSSVIRKIPVYRNGDGISHIPANRQEILQEALRWVSHGNIKDYMQEHRRDTDIRELKSYFNDVISWIEQTFDDVYPKMKGLNWGELYEKYHNNPYDHIKVSQKVKELYNDTCVQDKRTCLNMCLVIAKIQSF